MQLYTSYSLEAQWYQGCPRGPRDYDHSLNPPELVDWAQWLDAYVDSAKDCMAKQEARKINEAFDGFKMA